MAKRCEGCGAPAVDARSLFCNICGGAIRDEPDEAVPVCPACGVPAPDDLSAFCTRCGRSLEPDPEYPVCTSCGSIVRDEEASFCNRCGGKVSGMAGIALPDPQAVSRGPGRVQPDPAASPAAGSPVSVVIRKKRPPVPLPLVRSPPEPSGVPPERETQRKYAHLPLVGEALRDEPPAGGGFFSDTPSGPGSSRRKTGARKRGILGYFRR